MRIHDFSGAMFGCSRRLAKISLPFLILLVGGCTGRAGPGDGENKSTSSVSSPSLLSVIPGEMSECGPETGIAKVSWDAHRSDISRVRIEVGQMGSEQSRTFFIGSSKSSSYTEKWVRVGTVFILLDDETGEFLKSYEMRAVPCL